MDKDYQNTNSIIEAANDNKAKKPEHVITAEISIEVTGEEEPTKYDKRRERWGVVSLWSLVALIMSTLFFFFVNMNAYAFWIAVISGIVLGVALANDISADAETGHSPWWYGAC